MRTVAFVLLAASALLGQDAKIIIVERHDTQSLKSAYADYKAAQAKWEKVKNEVAKKYTVESGKTLEGWDKVEFSVDFRALVPQRVFTSNNWFTPSVLTTNAVSSGTITGTSDAVRSSDSVRSDLSVSEPITQITTGDHSPNVVSSGGDLVIEFRKTEK